MLRRCLAVVALGGSLADANCNSASSPLWGPPKNAASWGKWHYCNRRPGDGNTRYSYMVRDDNMPPADVAPYVCKDANKVPRHDVDGLLCANYNLGDEYGGACSDRTCCTRGVCSAFDCPPNFTRRGNDVSCYFGCDVDTCCDPSPQFPVPKHHAAGMVFVDTDPGRFSFGGTATILRAVDETDITHYRVYWGFSLITRKVPSCGLKNPVSWNTEKYKHPDKLFREFPVTGCDITFEIPQGTKPNERCPINWDRKNRNTAGTDECNPHYFMVVAVNANGEKAVTRTSEQQVGPRHAIADYNTEPTINLPCAMDGVTMGHDLPGPNDVVLGAWNKVKSAAECAQLCRDYNNPAKGPCRWWTFSYPNGGRSSNSCWMETQSLQRTHYGVRVMGPAVCPTPDDAAPTGRERPRCSRWVRLQNTRPFDGEASANKRRWWDSDKGVNFVQKPQQPDKPLGPYATGEQCQAICDLDPLCIGYLYMKRWVDGLHKHCWMIRVDTKLRHYDTAWDMWMCARENMAPSLVNGFDFQSHPFGYATCKGVAPYFTGELQDTDCCAALCDSDAACNAFTFAHHGHGKKGRCELFRACPELETHDKVAGCAYESCFDGYGAATYKRTETRKVQFVDMYPHPKGGRGVIPVRQQINNGLMHGVKAVCVVLRGGTSTAAPTSAEQMLAEEPYLSNSFEGHVDHDAVAVDVTRDVDGGALDDGLQYYLHCGFVDAATYGLPVTQTRSILLDSPEGFRFQGPKGYCRVKDRCTRKEKKLTGKTMDECTSACRSMSTCQAIAYKMLERLCIIYEKSGCVYNRAVIYNEKFIYCFNRVSTPPAVLSSGKCDSTCSSDADTCAYKRDIGYYERNYYAPKRSIACCAEDECTPNPCGDGQTCADPNTSPLSKLDFTCTCDADTSKKATGGAADCPVTSPSCVSSLPHCPADFVAQTHPTPDTTSPCETGNCKVRLNQWQIDRVLEQHNDYRARHGACPVTYNTMVEDYVLGSAGFATTCNTGKLTHNNGGPYGENIATQGRQIKGHTWDTAEGVHAWYCKEEGCFVYNDAKFTRETGHFTQVVWKGSLEIGCGICSIQEPHYNKVYLMCNYKAPGNSGAYSTNVKPSGTAVGSCVPDLPAGDIDYTVPSGGPCPGAVPATRRCESKECVCNAFKTKAAPASATSHACQGQGKCRSRLQQWQIESLVAQHNLYREHHGACPVTYDTALETDAFGSAAFDKMCSTGVVSFNSPSGENILMRGGFPNVQTYDPASAASDWYCLTEGCYDYDDPKFSSSTGSFTQVVWRLSTRIGCALCHDNTGAFTKLYVLCKYASPGNNGQFTTNVKRPKSVMEPACSVDECQPNPCTGGQTCNDADKSAPNNFVCTCANGVTATGAAAVCEKDECTPNPCGAGQTCKEGSVASNSLGDFTCTCDADTSKKATGGAADCSVDECQPNPCTGGQTCNDADKSAPNNFVCTCANGVTATGAAAVCEKDECTPNPCGAGQTCKEGSVASNSLGDFTCTCDADTSKKATGGAADCSVDECQPNPCTGGQTCNDADKSAPNNFVCTCANGVTATGAAAVCEKDECTPNPCGAGQMCKEGSVASNSLGDFTCTCDADTSKKATGGAADCSVDECQPNPCTGGQTCNDADKSAPNNFVCTCANGVTATGAAAVCEKDECTPNPCGAGQTCKEGSVASNSLGDFTCTCDADTSKKATGGAAACSVDECQPNPCTGGQTCNDADKSAPNNFVCTCANGVTATGAAAVCEKDECTPNPCGAGQTCKEGSVASNSLGDFTCTCDADTSKKATGGAADCSVDECQPNPCTGGQTCNDADKSAPNNFVCTCANGVTATGAAAVCEKDECTPNPCGAGQMCKEGSVASNSLGDFTCTCDADTSKKATGGAADCSVDECQPNPCTGGQTCNDADKSAPNNFVCTCANGVTATGAAAVCEKDECTPNPCGAGQTCKEGSVASNSLGDFTCTCDADTSKKATGGAAACSVDECQPNPCTGGQTCNDADKSAPNNFVCTCANGVTATGAAAVCEKDECTPNPCGAGQMCKEGSVASNSLGDFTCTCDADTSKKATGGAAACSVDECQPNPCTGGQTCNDADKSAPNNFVCTCANGVTATGAAAVCEKDECTPNPCGAGQTCKEGSVASNSLGDFTCTCDADTSKKATGGAADCSVDECQPNPCTGGQTCNDADKSAPNNFVCTCANGVTATGAAAVCEKDECTPNPCGAGQTCKEGSVASNSLGDFTCTCDADTSKKATGGAADCSVDECQPNPCTGGQTCNDADKSAPNNFVCTCANGVTATGAAAVCEKDECTPNPCGAGQTCKEGSVASNSLGDFTCTCDADTSKKATGGAAACSVDECQPNPCTGGQTCNDADKSAPNNFVCTCANGVTATGAAAVCEKDECTPNPCGAGQTCKEGSVASNSLGDFTCTCDADTSKKATGGAAACSVDECQPNPCTGGQTCNDADKSAPNNFVCTCANGVTATGAAAVCEKDECTPNPCGAGQTCKEGSVASNSLGDFTCTCDADTSKKATGGAAACSVDECQPNPCTGGQTCNDADKSAPNNFVCTCANGVTATGAAAVCEKDECTPNPCGAGQTCKEGSVASNSLGDFTCTCDADTSKKATGGAADCSVDECQPNPCTGGQTCNDADKSAPNNFVCTCANGVTATGAAAVCEKDECTPNPCGAGQTCKEGSVASNSLGDFTCTCDADTSKKATGGAAACSVDECQPNPCTGGQTCNDADKSAPNNFVCTCANGVTATGAAAVCEKDECTPNPCGAGQTCKEGSVASNSLGDFTCTCDADTSKKATGGAADCSVDECQPNPCTGGQTCNDADKSAPNNFVCTCANGVTATGAAAVCEKDECTPNPCGAGQTCKEGSVASNSLGDFTCTCDADTSKKATGGAADCSVDECQPNPCTGGQTCNDADKSAPNNFVCTCANGVTATGAAAVCEKDECTPNPCGAGQTCKEGSVASNSLGDFTCTCDADTSKKATGGAADCSVDECQPNPCTGGQTCNDADKSAPNNFVCTCANGVTATGAAAVCEKDECTPNPCGAGQTCKEGSVASNSLGDFTCTCVSDFASLATGRAAVCIIRECKFLPCASGQVCTDHDTSALLNFVCTCGNGVSSVGKSAVCEKDECLSNPCGPAQSCRDTNVASNNLQDFICTCTVGFGTARGQAAVCTEDECASNPCGVGQDCSDDRTLSTPSNNFVCTCRIGMGTKTGGPAECHLPGATLTQSSSSEKVSPWVWTVSALLGVSVVTAGAAAAYFLVFKAKIVALPGNTPPEQAAV